MCQPKHTHIIDILTFSSIYIYFNSIYTYIQNAHFKTNVSLSGVGPGGEEILPSMIINFPGIEHSRRMNEPNYTNKNTLVCRKLYVHRFVLYAHEKCYTHYRYTLRRQTHFIKLHSSQKFHCSSTPKTHTDCAMLAFITCSANTLHSHTIFFLNFNATDWKYPTFRSDISIPCEWSKISFFIIFRKKKHQTPKKWIVETMFVL